MTKKENKMSKLKILMLDDQQGPIFANIIVNFCEIDCDMKIVTDLASAETALEQSHYDFIFIDYNLGNGSYGYQIMDTVNKTQEKITTVLLTSESADFVEEKRKKHGIEYYIDKNYTNIMDMVNRFQKILQN